MNKVDISEREKRFIHAYFQAIDFTEEDGAFDIYSGLDEDFERESIIDCLAFYSKHCMLIPNDRIEDAGHDFWLTRQRHGAGFWDGDWSDYQAEVLTKSSEFFGEVYPIYNY